MFCKNCQEDQKPMKGVEIIMTGINQCQSCRCAISRVGIPVIPAGKYPLTRKERILDRPYWRR